jgi:hypothetical protein
MKPCRDQARGPRGPSRRQQPSEEPPIDENRIVGGFRRLAADPLLYQCQAVSSLMDIVTIGKILRFDPRAN